MNEEMYFNIKLFIDLLQRTMDSKSPAVRYCKKSLLNQAVIDLDGKAKRFYGPAIDLVESTAPLPNYDDTRSLKFGYESYCDDGCLMGMINIEIPFSSSKNWVKIVRRMLHNSITVPAFKHKDFPVYEMKLFSPLGPKIHIIFFRDFNKYASSQVVGLIQNNPDPLTPVQMGQ